MMTDNLLPQGTLLDGGKYRVEQPLASGGFGNTYLVTDLRMGARCVVKEFFMSGVNVRQGVDVTVSVPANHSTFEEQRRKFSKEAQRLFRLNDPHIVRVHSLFDDNGTSYYVMDYIEGQSLLSLLQQQGQPMPEVQVRNILVQMLDALQVVHGQAEPLYHMDIKPGNIMLDGNGRAVLIDFGASKQMATASGEAHTTTAMSYTPGYAPVEQIEQDLSHVGPWTDFYALGATVYRLLTNSRPPSITSLGTADAFVYPQGVSGEMRCLVSWMMALAPSSRPQSVQDIRRFLDSAHGEQTVITPPSPPPTANGKPGKTRWALVVAACVLGLLAVAMAAFLFTRSGVSHDNDTPRQHEEVRADDVDNTQDEERPRQSAADTDEDEEAEATTASKSSISDEDLAEELADIIETWDRSHALSSDYHLPALYADRVKLYGEMCSREEVIAKKIEAIDKVGGLHQTSSHIRLSRLSPISARCDFDKHTECGNGKVGDYPSYLYFELIDGEWYIVEESDLITDRNLKKRK